MFKNITKFLIKKSPTFIAKFIFSLRQKQYNTRDAAKFWKQKIPPSNNPKDYLSPIYRSEFLYKFMPRLEKEAKILEIGSNVGRNLFYLHKQGFKNLQGIEINRYAVKVGKEIYPNLYKSCKIYIGEGQKVLPKFADNSFDLIFTMATLQHIPDSKVFFTEIIKKTRKYLLTIEDETHITQRHFPKNYKKIFEKLGLKQIKSIKNIHSPDEAFTGFHARLFIKS